MSAPVPKGRHVVPLDVVERLVGTQFPHWAGLPLTRIEPGGWDNCSFRLGETMLVRLPSAPWYANQVEREQFWLPRLAAMLPLPIPHPIATGLPSDDFAMAWSVYEWIVGEPATTAEIIDPATFARTLASFLAAFQRIDSTGGPPPGPDNFGRGGPLAVYANEVAAAIEVLADGRVASAQLQRTRAIWMAALGAPHVNAPVWVHGDIAPGNLIVRDGKLAAVIDFGQFAVGDPACDLAICWTWLDAVARRAFRDTLQLDEAHWMRARGWALWKALILIAGLTQSTPGEVERARLTLDRLTDD